MFTLGLEKGDLKKYKWFANIDKVVPLHYYQYVIM